MLMVVVKGVTFKSCAWARRLCLFSFDLAEMVFLRIWISARRVFASRVGFACLCLGGCVEVAGGVWRECV